MNDPKPPQRTKSAAPIPTRPAPIPPAPVYHPPANPLDFGAAPQPTMGDFASLVANGPNGTARDPIHIVWDPTIVSAAWWVRWTLLFVWMPVFIMAGASIAAFILLVGFGFFEFMSYKPVRIPEAETKSQSARMDSIKKDAGNFGDKVAGSLKNAGKLDDNRP